MTARRRVGRAGALADRVTVVAHRAPTQLALLAAVLAVVVAGTTVLGLCVLLLTAGERATLDAALRATSPDDVVVRAELTVVGGDPVAIADRAADLVEGRLDAVPTTTTTWVTSGLRALPGAATRMAYLAGVTTDLADHATLTSGRWPGASAPTAGGPLEAVVLDPTASALGLAVGDQVPLTTFTTTVAQPLGGAPADEVVVRVVGTVATLPGAGWELDLLGGTGADAVGKPGTSGRVELPAYGPFLVDGTALLGGDAGVAHLGLLTRPDLVGATPRALADAAAALDGTRRVLALELGEDVTDVRVATALPGTVRAAATQQTVTRAGVQVAALVGLALTAAALALAGRLVAGRREAETALLAARGAGRSQLVLQAALESLAVAALATVAAVPLALAAYRALGTSPRLAAAGLGTGAGVTPALVLAVVAGALALAAVLTGLTGIGARARATRGRRTHGGDLARSGADVVLVALAVVAALQAQDHTVVAGGGRLGGTDPVLVAAPVLCLLAGATLVLRVVPAVLHGADRRARRSTGLVRALAAWDLARRPQSAGLAFLLVLATGVATFAVAAGATWSASQQDQADARTGTDVALDATSLAPLAQGPAVAAVGGTAAPVTDRPVAVGRWRGDEVPHLVALDTSRAGTLLRGRLPAGAGWGELTADLGPADRVTGLPVSLARDGGTDLTLTGTGEGDGVPLVLTPTLVLEDAWGTRTPLTGEAQPLDGTTRPVVLPPQPVGGELELVAVSLRVTLGPEAFVPPESAASARVEVTLAAGTAADGATAWSTPEEHEFSVWSLGATGDARSLTTSATVMLGALGGVPTALSATAFDAPTAVPVLVTADVADATGLRDGSMLSLAVGDTEVRAEVAGVAPYLPSAPGTPGVLADLDVLGRALLAVGDVSPLGDRWWLADEDPAAAAGRAQAAGLEVTGSRAELAGALRDGPLRVGVPTALALLVVAAVVLALAGTALHTAASVEARALEVARLQGVGVPRRSLIGALVLEHAVLVALVVALGALVGAATAWTVAPALAASETGAPPVPGASPVWPWAAQGPLLAALLLAPVAVVVPVVVRLVRLATAAHLRVDGPA